MIALSGNRVEKLRNLPVLYFFSLWTLLLCFTNCSIRFAESFMAQTVQSGAKSVSAGSKRKNAPTDPVTPTKKTKTVTARKRTGGKAPRRLSGAGNDANSEDGPSGSRSGAQGMFFIPSRISVSCPELLEIRPTAKKEESLPTWHCGLARDSKISTEYRPSVTETPLFTYSAYPLCPPCPTPR
jgi:hypothetical protein